MRNRLRRTTQRLIRMADIVMASRVQLVRGECSCEHLQCAPVIAGGLRRHAEKVQTLHMRGLARQDLTANLLRFADPAPPVAAVCFSKKIGNAGAYRAPGERVGRSCALAATLMCCPPLFPVHSRFIGLVAATP